MKKSKSKEDFIDKMLESGYSRSLALRALSSGIDPSEIGEGMFISLKS